MAGRHRKPPAWRRVLTSMLRSRNRVRTAAMRAEIIALRATIADLQAELVALRETSLAAARETSLAAARETSLAAARETSLAAARQAPQPVVLDLPLVRLALDDVAVDRGPDTALTEIVLEPARAPADRLAWSVLASLPERELLDPAIDRGSEPIDVTGAPRDVAERRSA